MRVSRPILISLLSAASLALIGCSDPRGKPGPEPEVPRPDQVLDFATLYKQNCVACHGNSHEPGAAIFLANPVYLAVAGEDNLKAVITNGVPGKLMPPFARSAGGMLTDQQVDILAKGLISTWGKPGVLDSLNPPTYKATADSGPSGRTEGLRQLLRTLPWRQLRRRRRCVERVDRRSVIPGADQRSEPAQHRHRRNESGHAQFSLSTMRIIRSPTRT